MPVRFFITVIFTGVVLLLQAQQKITVTSPNQQIRLEFMLTTSGVPTYEVSYKSKPVILSSALGFSIRETGIEGNDLLPTLADSLVIVSVKQTTVNNQWQPVWGEVKIIQDHYNQAIISLSQKGTKPILMNIIFKIFDDGVGFRYQFPQQANLSYFTVQEEQTSFHLTGNHKTFWIPGDYDTNEYPPSTTNLSEVDNETVRAANPEIGTRVLAGKDIVQTPLMLKTADGLYINIHEAALVNYPAMQLHVDKSNYDLSSRLVPDALGNKAYLQAPFATPWRTIIVSDKATDILASKMIFNLNEPSVIKDVSWIHPSKFVGIWWGMQVGTYSWSYTDDLATMKPHGHHGATTERTKQYIDFAAANGMDAVLVEGWNIGWEDWFGKWKENVFDFITPYPDYDVKAVTDYAKKKGVKIIMHHETSGSATNYERYMDTAYRFMKKYGYDAVKTGYVGKIIPRGEHHDGQWMNNHYVYAAKKTAGYHIMIDMHEPVRPTGLQRTYPNWLANEAARGNEFNAFSKGNMPEHETILPFTRLMGGPMDYTPGIFNIKLDKYGTPGRQVHTTLCKQLALYVTMYSPLQMAADMIENYQPKMDAFQFIKEVPVDWDDSRYLEAEPGDYITVARKAKGKNNWFIGAITDENGRNTNIQLDFLDAGKKYTATIYADGANAHWQTNPEAYIITRQTVDNKTVLNLKLAPGGGCAVSILMQ